MDESAWERISSIKIRAYTSKNIIPKQSTFHLLYTFLFLSNFVFKFNIVRLVSFCITFTTIYLPFCLLINLSFFTNHGVYPVPLCTFVRPLKLKLLKVCSLTAKFTFHVYNCLQFLPAAEELGNSLHDAVYMCQLILLYVRTKIIVIVIFCF